MVEAIDERSCTLHTGSNSLDELAVHVALIGQEFRVHEPPELVDHIHALAPASAARRADPIR